MLKHIYLILSATFIFGFVCGALFFLQSHTGGEGDGDINTHEDTFSITAHTYGGCERGGQCVSYRISDGKEYTYITRNVDGTTGRFEGTLERDEARVLATYVSEADFESFTAPLVGECSVTTDGLAYRYTITMDDAEYTFDSCKTLLVGVPLFDSLEGYFTYFAHTHDTENE